MTFDWNNTTSENTSSHGVYEEDPSGVHYVTYVFSVLCTSWAIIANSVIISCFYRARKRKWSIFTRLTCSMSISDVLVGMVTIPFYVIAKNGRSTNGIFCFCLFYFIFAFQCVTLFHVLGICIFRNIKIKNVSEQIDETKYKIHSYIVIILAWTSAFVVVFCPFITWNKTSNEKMYCFYPNIFSPEASLFLALSYFIPQLLTNVIYAMTCYRFYRTNRIVPEPNEAVENTVPSTLRKIENPVPSCSRKIETDHNVFYVASKKKQITITTIGNNSPGTLTSFTSYKNEYLKNQRKVLGKLKMGFPSQLDIGHQRENETQFKKSNQEGSNSHQNDQTTVSTKKRVLVTIGMLLVLFNVLTLPTTIALFVMKSTPSSADSKVLISNLFVINSGLNAIVNATRVKSLRDDVKEFLRKCVRVLCCCCTLHAQ